MKKTSRHEKRGKVYLVGAGPGRADLLTLKAVRCLGEADVVLHDRLVPLDAVRRHAPRARLVDVGKEKNAHDARQEEIENIMVREAKRGLVVVRLKGGDPMIFGRGGEEAERLADAGVPFELVPGVSSVFAAPLFAGIPLTHRKLSSGVAIVTGHGDGAAGSLADGASFAGTGTLVILMGMAKLRENMDGLAARGVASDTPAAVVQWGTTGRQRTLVGRVGDIAEKCARAGLGAPAVVVVGRVAALAAKLDWFGRGRFHGRTFLLTRAAGDNDALRETLENEGAEVIESPAFEYAACRLDASGKAALRKIATFDWIVFTSARAVDFFCGAYGKFHKDVRDLCGVKIACVGSRTEAALRARGLWADLKPARATAAELARAAAFARRRGLRVFLPRAADARCDFAAVHARRHEITEAVLYRKRRAALDDAVRAALSAKKIDWTLFYSPATVDYFLSLFPGARDVLEKCRIAAIGPTTARHIEGLGLPCAVRARSGDERDLLRRIGAHEAGGGRK